MLAYVIQPEIKKPKWLKEFLENQSLDIFTWRQWMPTFMEMGFDWLIWALNTRFQDLYGALAEAWSWMASTTAYLDSEFKKVKDWLEYLDNKLAVQADTLDAWFLAKKHTVQAWAIAAMQPVTNMISVHDLAIKTLNENQLKILEVLKTPWWAPTRILSAIAEALSPFKKLEEDRKNLFEWMWLFFADPPKFLYEMADEIITRFW